jgi:PAS domain S-box-containing protein
MGAPKRDRTSADVLGRFRNLQLEGAGKDAVTELFHELQVHQEELSAQNHQLIETQNALEESRDRYVDLYDFAPIGYMTINPGGMIREINLTGAALLGRERGHVVGLPFNSFVVSNHKPVFSDHLRHCQYIEHGSATIELTLSVGKPPTSVQLVTRRHRGHANNEPVFLTAIIDVTGRRKLEQERRDAEEARDKLSRDREFARARADAKDHFLATLSHELRTPLTPIVATMSNHRLISLAPEPLRAALQTVRRNLDLEVRLIDDLLDMTRISRDLLALTLEHLDLQIVVQEVVEMLDAETHRHDLTIVTTFDAPDHSVMGDPVRLRQVFWNLLGNAIKFTPAGGTIRIASAPGPIGFIDIIVSDTGIGMDRDVISSINAEGDIARHAPIQSAAGLGLGLAICRGIIKAHGGSLRAVSSGTGRGSTFVVQIPVTAHAEQRDRPPKPAQASQNQPARRLRILLVEDHRDSADTLSQLLSLHGFDMSVARTMQDALQAAEQGVDFVISDIRLPDGSGLELMRRLRVNQPIVGIAISGFGTEQDQRRSREAGFDVHLTKPVDFGRLLEAIEQVSAARRGTT